jgi:hypothetical protein
MNLGRLLEWWCFLMHSDITWPCYGRYTCRKCGRVYAVPWDEGLRLRRLPSELPVNTVLQQQARTA